MLGVVLGWLISLGCLAFAIAIVGSLALEPAARRDIHSLGYSIAAIAVSFYGSVGVVLNPMVFVRLARAVWLRCVIVAAIVGAATAGGWLVAICILAPV